MLEHLLPQISLLNARLAANGDRVAKVIEQLATRIDTPAAIASKVEGPERSSNPAERLRTDVIQPEIATTIKKMVPRPTSVLSKSRIDTTSK